MEKAGLLDLNNRIKNEIQNTIEVLEKKPRDYINDIVVLINREIGINKILSIILFGSQRVEHACESTVVSDCDLIVIFKDRVSNRHIKEIERYFIALESKYQFRDPGKKFTKKILGVITKTTGMFVSHFLTKKQYWENAIFHKIFRVNKVISSIFAPRKIVLCSVLDNSTILYGEDSRDIVRQKLVVPPFDIIKSTAMNLIISIFSLGISPIKSLGSMKYQLEAVKWSLRASNYFSFEDSEPLEMLAKRFMSLEKPKNKKRAEKFYNDFIQLRKNPKPDLYFMLRAPFRVLKIHIKGILFKKMIRQKKLKFN